MIVQSARTVSLKGKSWEGQNVNLMKEPLPCESETRSLLLGHVKSQCVSFLRSFNLFVFSKQLNYISSHNTECRMMSRPTAGVPT